MFKEFNDFDKYTLDELDEFGVLDGNNTKATHKQIGYIHGLLKKAQIDEEEFLKELDYEYTMEINPKHPFHELTVAEATEIIEYLLHSDDCNPNRNLRRF